MTLFSWTYTASLRPAHFQLRSKLDMSEELIWTGYVVKMITEGGMHGGKLFEGQKGTVCSCNFFTYGGFAQLKTM